MEEESWRGIMEEESWRGIMRGELCKRSHEEGIWRTSERHLGIIRSALRASGRRP